jgi:cytochrome oxidase Cu insertion factor (SCO1/SenC/PrrC family)
VWKEIQLVDDATSSTLQTHQRPRVGDPLPDVTLRTMDGQPFQLNSLRGQRALIFMWASW